MEVVKRFEVYLISLDPVRGSEIKKTRPCLIVSPDEMNAHLRTVIVAPMTTARRDWPTRVRVNFAGKDGEIALDQIRTVDKQRLVRRLGRVADATADTVASRLVEMFARG